MSLSPVSAAPAAAQDGPRTPVSTPAPRQPQSHPSGPLGTTRHPHDGSGQAKDQQAVLAVDRSGTLAAPDAPTVTNTDKFYPKDAAGITAAGTPGLFTFTAGNAAEFLYDLDASPATSNTPAREVVAATGNSADVTITPTAPGTHTLYVYAVDSAGNVSNQQQYQFTALGHTGRTYPGSLQQHRRHRRLGQDGR